MQRPHLLQSAPNVMHRTPRAHSCQAWRTAGCAVLDPERYAMERLAAYNAYSALHADVLVHMNGP